MKIKEIFSNYENFCLLYRKKGTYIAYKKSFKFLMKIFDELGIESYADLDTKTYNSLIKHIKVNRSKKIVKLIQLFQI